MKIIAFSTGFIDFTHVLTERDDEGDIFRDMVLISRDRRYIERMEDVITSCIDYYDIMEEENDGRPDVDERVAGRLKNRISAQLGKTKDVMLVASSESIELAALPVIQEICGEKKARFHVLLIAPFLFQGKKRAGSMRRMLNLVDNDTYSSVSLYYPDELLKLSDNSGSGEQEYDPDDYTMQNAYNRLEMDIADIVEEMYEQIPKLDKGMQYMYDFKLEEFSLAVEPLKLIKEMWNGVLSNDELFKPQMPANPENTTVKELAAITKAIGILNPNRKNDESSSVYRPLAQQSIPLNEYRSQLSESRLSALVNTIKGMISDEGPVNPEMKKKAAERLAREINKFQVRQAEVRAEYGGEAPTMTRGAVSAIADIHLDDSPGVKLPDSSQAQAEQAGTVFNKNMGETPYQRAARLAARNEKAAKAPVHKTPIPETGEQTETIRTEAGQPEPEPTASEPAISASAPTTPASASESASASAAEPASVQDTSNKSNTLNTSDVSSVSSVSNVSNVSPTESADIRTERQRKKDEKKQAKMSRRLAKAEEKAKIAAAKAERAAMQVKIIAREENANIEEEE